MSGIEEFPKALVREAIMTVAGAREKGSSAQALPEAVPVWLSIHDSE